MTAQPVKTSDLPVVDSLDGTDRIVVLSGAASLSETSTITLTDLFGNSSSVPVINTPANSTALTVSAGSVMMDADYLYVAVANNKLGRVALSTF